MASEPDNANSALGHATFDESQRNVELLGRFGFCIELLDGDEGAGDGHGEGFLSGSWGWGDEAADGLDAVERDWAEGDHVSGFGGDDPVGGADGDADVAVVVDGDGASVEDEVAGSYWFGLPRSRVST